MYDNTSPLRMEFNINILIKEEWITADQAYKLIDMHESDDLQMRRLALLQIEGLWAKENERAWREYKGYPKLPREVE